jgi:hypothetical protein
VRVSRGEVLYFIVDPRDGDYFCDTTQLNLTITAQGPWSDHDEEDTGDDESGDEG